MQKTLKKYFPVFLLPTVIAFCIAFIIPFVTGLYLSFCDFTTVSNAKFVGFTNYIKAFSSSQRFGQAFGFTTLFTIISIITVNIIAFTLAYLLTRKIKGTNNLFNFSVFLLFFSFEHKINIHKLTTKKINVFMEHKYLHTKMQMSKKAIIILFCCKLSV